MYILFLFSCISLVFFLEFKQEPSCLCELQAISARTSANVSWENYWIMSVYDYNTDFSRKLFPPGH